jgi:hypothetical protein
MPFTNKALLGTSNQKWAFNKILLEFNFMLKCLIPKKLYEPFWPKAFRGPLSPMETLDKKTTIIKKCLEFYFLEGLVYSKNPKC